MFECLHGAVGTPEALESGWSGWRGDRGKGNGKEKREFVGGSGNGSYGRGNGKERRNGK